MKHSVAMTSSMVPSSEDKRSLQWMLGSASKDGFDTLWRALDPRREAEADSQGRVRLSGGSSNGATARLELGLPALFEADKEDIGTGLEILPEILGEGGMGVVHLAHQACLRREVAIKVMRPDCPDAVFDMVREALITARLQHPNIIPVHRLCQDESGRPILVMQRIEGQSWADLLHQDWRACSGNVSYLRFLDEAVLERHLRVLLQVCQAVAFAHSRGVIHRDLKPANVMLGPFGEVYLVDWGLAVCRGAVARELQLEPQAPGLVGTPCYMAPEMLLESEEALDERTDVYQLGAVLHEILCGNPPHPSGDLRNVLFSVFRSEPPQLPPIVPHELARITKRALARNPAERFANASELRQDLEDFLAHRGSIQLSAEAYRRLDGVSVEMIRNKSLSEREISTRFNECRFAFLQALAIWPQNSEARAGLQAAVELMIRHELELGSPDSAALLLADLPEPEPQLEQKVRAEVARTRQERDGLLQERKEADLASGDAARRGFALILAAFWFVVPTVIGVLHNLGELTVTSKLGYVLYPLLHGAIQALGLYYWRAVLLVNRVNRLMALGSLVVFVPLAILRLVAMQLELPIDRATGLEIPLYTAVLFSITVCLDQRLVWATLASLLAGLGAALVPQQSYLWLGLGNGATLFLVWLAWRGDQAASQTQQPSKLDSQASPSTL